MRIAIIEDNEAEARLLQERVSALYPGTHPPKDIDLYASGAQYMEQCRYYDLLLIDCILPDFTGVTLAKQIQKAHPASIFIFVTAYMEFAAEGYETNAIRYLLKPITDDKLSEALIHFDRLIAVDPVLELTGTNKHTVYAKRSQILYVETTGRKTVVRLENTTVYSQKSLLTFESELGSDLFFRTHRQFLVNLRHIVRKDNDTLVLSNGERVTISRRNRAAFNTMYMRYLKTELQ